jgi:hypothetical protein
MEDAVCEIRHVEPNDLTIGLVDRYGRFVSTQSRSEYDVELRACFVFSIRSTLEGPRGLARDEIEALIEANWLWVSIDTEVLLESHWQLEAVEERAVSDDGR